MFDCTSDRKNVSRKESKSSADLLLPGLDASLSEKPDDELPSRAPDAPPKGSAQEQRQEVQRVKRRRIVPSAVRFG